MNHWLLTSVAILMSLSLQAQTPLIDSLKNDVGNAINYDDSLTRYSNVVKYTYSTNPDVAEWAVDRFLALAEKHDNSSEIARSYNLYGIVFQYSSQSEKAIDAYATAIRMYDGLQDTLMMAILHNNISSIYKQRGRVEETLKHFAKARVLVDAIRDTSWMINVRLNEIVELNKVDRYEEAKYKLDEVDLLKKGISDATTIGYIAMRKGFHYAMLKEYDLAEQYDLEALENIDPELDPANVLAVTCNLVSLHLDNDRQEKAIKWFSNAVKLEEHVSDPESKGMFLETGHKLKKDIGDYKGALSYNERLAALRQETFDENIDQRLVDALAKYESEKKDKEIQIRDLQLKQSELELGQRKRMLWFYSLTILAAMGLLSYLIYLARSRKVYADKLESALGDKEILLREIHHRVKNNLQVVSSLLSIQSRGIEDAKALEAVEESRNRVKSMALIHQNLYSEDNLTGIDVKDYIEKLSSSLFNSYRVDKGRIKLETDIQSLNLDIDTTIPLGLILNELLSNALKYAFDEGEEGVIKVRLKEGPEGLELLVIDNGKGINAKVAAEKNSFGIKMIKAFANKLNAAWEITSNDGTQARMVIKNY